MRFENAVTGDKLSIYRLLQFGTEYKGGRYLSEFCFVYLFIFFRIGFLTCNHYGASFQAVHADGGPLELPPVLV